MLGATGPSQDGLQRVGDRVQRLAAKLAGFALDVCLKWYEHKRHTVHNAHLDAILRQTSVQQRQGERI